jgi:hypothetical protein
VDEDDDGPTLAGAFVSNADSVHLKESHCPSDPSSIISKMLILSTESQHSNPIGLGGAVSGRPAVGEAAGELFGVARIGRHM